MEYKQLIKEITKGTFKPVYLIYAEDMFFSDAIVQAVQDQFIPREYQDFNQLVVYGKEITTQALVDMAREYPFMSDRKLIIVKDSNELKNAEQLIGLFKHPNPQCLLLMIFSKKPDGRLAWIKAAKEQNSYYEFKALSEYQLPSFVKSMIADQNLQIEDQALWLMLDYIGNDLSTYQNEINKLKINIEKGEKISEELISKFIGISREFNVFELQRALSQRDKSRCHWIAKNMSKQLKSNPLVMTIAALFNHFQRIWLTKMYAKLNDDALNNVVKLPFKSFLKEYREASSKYSMSSLEQAIAILKQFDMKSKGMGTGAASEEDLYLELVIKLSNV